VELVGKREDVAHIIEQFQMSERRACELLDVDRSSYRYRRRADRNVGLRRRLLELAGERPRFGYRRLWLLLNHERGPINRKRIERLYREAGLKLRRRSRKRLKTRVLERPILTAPNQEWSMDFVHDQLSTGQRFRTLTIIDNFTRECLALEVDTCLPSLRVIRVLDEIAGRRALPQVIRTDNGPEFTSRRFLSWSVDRRVRATTIQPGKPVQNPFIESFNGRFRDECLNMNWFANLTDARWTVQRWRLDYNGVRPHSSLSNRSPEAFRRGYEGVGEFPIKGELKNHSLNEQVSKLENSNSPW
jgi:putative transposase